MHRQYTVIIERDNDGYFIGTIPELKGCHTQAKSLDVLLARIKKAASLCLEVENDLKENELEFVRIQRITV